MTIEDDLFGEQPTRKPSINSRAKGQANEREAAKTLEEWTGYQFTRVPSSGGLRWKGDQEIYGDLVPQKEAEFPFIIETKHYKQLHLPKSGNLAVNSIFFRFMTQCFSDCFRYREETGKHKFPLVLARANGMPKGVYYVAFLPNCFPNTTPIAQGRMVNYIGTGQKSFLLKRKIFISLTSEVFKEDYADVVKRIEALPNWAWTE